MKTLNEISKPAPVPRIRIACMKNHDGRLYSLTTKDSDCAEREKEGHFVRWITELIELTYTPPAVVPKPAPLPKVVVNEGFTIQYNNRVYCAYGVGGGVLKFFREGEFNRWNDVGYPYNVDNRDLLNKHFPGWTKA